MTRGRYATVKIPMKLAEALDRVAEEMGYQSRADVVDDAIRRFIESRIELAASRRYGYPVARDSTVPRPQVKASLM